MSPNEIIGIIQSNKFLFFTSSFFSRDAWYPIELIFLIISSLETAFSSESFIFAVLSGKLTIISSGVKFLSKTLSIRAAQAAHVIPSTSKERVLVLLLNRIALFIK